MKASHYAEHMTRRLRSGKKRKEKKNDDERRSERNIIFLISFFPFYSLFFFKRIPFPFPSFIIL